MLPLGCVERVPSAAPTRPQKRSEVPGRPHWLKEGWDDGVYLGQRRRP